MPEVALLQTGDDFTKDKCDEVLAMVNERRAKVGLAAKAWTDYNPVWEFDPPSLQGADFYGYLITQVRTWIADAVPRYLNGTLEGATAPAYWTTATLLTSLGLGGNDGWGVRNWTNVPPDGDPQDLADYISALYGSDLPSGVTYYKVWLNEIILVARALNRLPFTLSSTGQQIRDGVSSGGSYAEARTGAVAAWETDSWSDYYGDILRYDMQWTGALIYANARSIRGKFTADLTALAGSAQVYLKLTPLNGGFGAMQDDGPVAGDQKYHYYADATPGAVYLSPYLADYVPALATEGTFTYGVKRGWTISALGLYTPSFTYT